ncbi:MAG: hypothetical protein ACI95S_002456, partial [Dinoroseobacter sp.]
MGIGRLGGMSGTICASDPKRELIENTVRENVFS